MIKEMKMMKYNEVVKKNNVIDKICHELDHLYYFAISLLPENITHDLGHKKELLKGIIEDLILVI